MLVLYLTLLNSPAFGHGRTLSVAQTVSLAQTDSGAGWVQTMGPGGGIIRALTLNPSQPRELYVGTPDAGVFRSTDGGEGWQYAMRGVTGNFIFHLAVDPRDGNIVYAAFVNGGLYKSFNRGLSWTALTPAIDAFSIAIDPTDTRVLYLGTRNGKIHKSNDGGITWQERSSGLPPAGGFSVSTLIVDPSYPQRIYASTGWWDDVPGVGIFRSENGGNSWENINGNIDFRTVSTLAMDRTNPQVLYAARGRPGDNPDIMGVFKTTDAGIRWVRVVNTGSPMSVSVAIDPNDSRVIYAGGHGGSLYKSVDAGANWVLLGRDGDLKTFLPLVVVTHLIVDPQDSRTVYAGGYHNGLAKSTDGGQTWKYINEGLVTSWVHSLAINPTNENVVYAGTMGDGIFKTTDGGSRWERLSQSYELIGAGAIALDPQNPDVVYVGTEYGYPGRVFKSTNGGRSWNKILAVDQGKNLQYHDGMVSAIVIDPSNTDVIYAAIAKAVNVSSELPGIYKSTDGGENWKLMNSGLTSLQITSMVIDRFQPNILYVGTDAGAFKSTNGGQSWQASSTGLTNPWIQSLALHPRQPSTLYAGARDGMIFRSTNAGASWALVYNNPNFRWDGRPWITTFDAPGEIGALAIDPVNPDTIYAGVMGLPFLVISNDGGTSWREISDVPAVHTVAISSNGEKVYAGTIGWGVFVLQQTHQSPTAPTELRATAVSSSQINLAWTAATDNVGVTAYKVYRGGVLIATLGNVTSYSDTGLTPSTTYSYTVQACDAVDNCSAWSAAAFATTVPAFISQSDCLFNWAERTYPNWFAPAGAISNTFAPYYYRYYPQTRAYLGASFADNHLYYLGPLSNNSILDVGTLSGWLSTAGCQ